MNDRNIIFVDDPDEQKLVRMRDEIIRNAEREEEEEKRRRVEQGDATARSLTSPIQFFKDEKEVAIVNAYDVLCDDYQKKRSLDDTMTNPESLIQPLILLKGHVRVFRGTIERMATRVLQRQKSATALFRLRLTC